MQMLQRERREVGVYVGPIPLWLFVPIAIFHANYDGKILFPITNLLMNRWQWHESHRFSATRLPVWRPPTIENWAHPPEYFKEICHLDRLLLSTMAVISSFWKCRGFLPGTTELDQGIKKGVGMEVEEEEEAEVNYWPFHRFIEPSSPPFDETAIS